MKTIYTLLILLLPIIGISQKVVSDQDVPKKDVIHNDDVIIDGSLNVGLDAIPNRAFGFDTQILSENNLRILFEDTSNSASFPSNDWRITINGSNNGDPSFFSIDDVDGGRVPFRIEAAARTNALYIESDGDIGIGTNNPAVDIDVKTGNNANMVVAVVIKQGRIRFVPASTTDALTSCFVLGEFLSNVCVKYVAITTPSSVAIPNKAINPTQTATLKLMGCI